MRDTIYFKNESLNWIMLKGMTISDFYNYAQLCLVINNNEVYIYQDIPFNDKGIYYPFNTIKYQKMIKNRKGEVSDTDVLVVTSNDKSEIFNLSISNIDPRINQLNQIKDLSIFAVVHDHDWNLRVYFRDLDDKLRFINYLKNTTVTIQSNDNSVFN
jgi:hypothetical protein